MSEKHTLKVKDPTHSPPKLTYQNLQALTLLRIYHILGDPNANPPIPPILPISKSSFYKLIAEGTIAAPLKFNRSSFWRLSDIKKILDEIGRGEVA